MQRSVSEAQKSVQETGPAVVRLLEHHVYLVALLGLAVYYGQERAVKEWLRQGKSHKRAETEPTVFWPHITSFAVYNALVGYLLLHRELPGWDSLAWYALAMALHFVVNDYGLRQDHQAQYHRAGRWLLAAAVWIGWLVGIAITLPEAATALLFAFLAGGVILNTLKEELREERRSRYWPFLLGATGYAVLLVAA